MRTISFQPNRFAAAPRRREQARAGTSVLLLAIVLIGLCLGALIYFRYDTKPAGQPAHTPTSSLSVSTREVLSRLESPVEIRLYALLDPSSVPDAVGEFAGRASQLLAEYESEAGGKITVNRFDSLSDASATAASADGIQPFNLDKGEACYLGIAVLSNGRREAIPLLSPEWEQALEADLSRAIARAARAAPVTQTLAKPSEENMAALDAVKRAIPNLDRVSVEDASLMLRQQALAETQAYARETEAKIKEAEQRFNQAQQSGNEAGQQAALKDLQQLQSEKTSKLQEVAAQTQARLDALTQLKKNSK